MINLDYKDKRPIYEQIIDKMKELMVMGVIPENAQLPSVRSLAVELSINPNTIQRAYAELERQGYIYSVNEGYREQWDAPAREAVEWFHTAKSSKGGAYSSRYVGSLVADFHRTLLYGGIYLYPPYSGKPDGKLRLMCEASPLAFLAEQAGGKASDGCGRILERVPATLHARTPLYIGSSRDVEAVEAIYARHKNR